MSNPTSHKQLPSKQGHFQQKHVTLRSVPRLVKTTTGRSYRTDKTKHWQVEVGKSRPSQGTRHQEA